MDGLFKQALRAAEQGKRYAFATIIESTIKGTPRKVGAKMIVFEDGSSFGTIGGGKYEKLVQQECLKALKTRKPMIKTYDYSPKSSMPCGGHTTVFIEPFFGIKRLIICGAGHIALPLSIIAKTLGFTVTVIDNRKAFANKKRFPHADMIAAEDHVRALKKLTIHQNAHIVIATHEHAHDLKCLKAVIGSDARYIGLIASKAKRTAFFTALKKSGVSESRLNKIASPAGVDIGAQTPQEIAVSIMAEIIALENKDFMGSSKFKSKKS